MPIDMRLQVILAVLATVTCIFIPQRSSQQSSCIRSGKHDTRSICELLDRRSSLRPRISNEPNSVVTTVDSEQESSVLFTCKAEWLRLPRRFCDFVDLSLESPENLTNLLGLSLEWEIDRIRSFNSTEALTPDLIQRGIDISTTCIINAVQLFDILVCGENHCEEHITRDLIPHCTSTINIARWPANSNVQLRCSVRPSECADEQYMDISSIVYLQLQGLLGLPPGLRIDELNSTTLYLSWNPPNTLSGIPISHYSVDINNLVTTSTVIVLASVNQPSINPNITSLDLSQIGSIGYLYDPGCESLQFIVRAWNSVGEGANSTVLYSQESLRNIKTYAALQITGILCILCEFNATTEAQGCQATIQEAVSKQMSTTIRRVLDLTVIRDGDQNSIIEAFDCVSGLRAGNYTVSVREIECSGGIGLREFTHRDVRVNGFDQDSRMSTCTPSIAPGEAAQETTINSQAIGFSVAIVVLTIMGVLLLVVVIILAIVRKSKNNCEVILKDHLGIPSSQQISSNNERHSLSHEQELLYDNDYCVRPMTNANPPSPTAEYSYTTVTRSGQQRTKMNSQMNNNSIEMKSCEAYGTTA